MGIEGGMGNRGERISADVPVQQVYEISDAHQSERFIPPIERLAPNNGSRRFLSDAGFTEIEIEVASRIGQGMANAAICVDLHFGQNALDIHLSSIYRRHFQDTQINRVNYRQFLVRDLAILEEAEVNPSDSAAQQIHTDSLTAEDRRILGAWFDPEEPYVDRKRVGEKAGIDSDAFDSHFGHICRTLKVTTTPQVFTAAIRHGVIDPDRLDGMRQMLRKRYGLEPSLHEAEVDTPTSETKYEGNWMERHSGIKKTVSDLAERMQREDVSADDVADVVGQVASFYAEGLKIERGPGGTTEEIDSSYNMALVDRWNVRLAQERMFTCFAFNELRPLRESNEDTFYSGVREAHERSWHNPDRTEQDLHTRLKSASEGTDPKRFLERHLESWELIRDSDRTQSVFAEKAAELDNMLFEGCDREARGIPPAILRVGHFPRPEAVERAMSIIDSIYGDAIERPELDSVQQRDLDNVGFALRLLSREGSRDRLGVFSRFMDETDMHSLTLVTDFDVFRAFQYAVPTFEAYEAGNAYPGFVRAAMHSRMDRYRDETVIASLSSAKISSENNYSV